MYNYLFYMQREPLLPNHVKMIQGLRNLLNLDSRFSSVKWRLEELDNLTGRERNVINTFCKKNKVAIELLICVQGIQGNKVDFVIGYGLGKYLKVYLDKLDIPWIDVAEPDLKERFIEQVNNKTITDTLFNWIQKKNKSGTYLMPEFINDELFDYREKQYA